MRVRGEHHGLLVELNLLIVSHPRQSMISARRPAKKVRVILDARADLFDRTVAHGELDDARMFRSVLVPEELAGQLPITRGARGGLVTDPPISRQHARTHPRVTESLTCELRNLATRGLAEEKSIAGAVGKRRHGGLTAASIGTLPGLVPRNVAEYTSVSEVICLPVGIVGWCGPVIERQGVLV